MTTDDVLVIGGGHNGLVCACYLARRGLRVRVLERRGVVGGAVCTEEIIPGYRFDVGSSLHIMIRATGIPEDLKLEEFGLEYLPADPWAFFPVAGSSKGICFYRDVEKTCASIAAISPHDAAAYRAFVARWGELNEGVFEVFQKVPTGGNLFGAIFKRNLLRPASRKLWSSMDTSRQLMMPYGRLINELFESAEMRAALAWLAAQSGPAPLELASGDLLGWNAMIHRIGAWRPRGGSGSLTRALARCLESHGGAVELDAEVGHVTREGSDGPFRVDTGRGVFRARAVVAACHVQTTFLDLLDPALVAPELRRRVANIHVGNGFGMIVRHAVGELPRYPGQPLDEHGAGDCHRGMQLLCPSVDALESAWHDFLQKRPPREPAVLAMTFSAIDPTLAPPGKHTLFAWAQYHPYELAPGEGDWDEIAEREADKIWEVVCRYAPNMRGKMIGRYIQTPLEIERKLALRRGNVMHVEMSLDQMFCFRPLPELSTYRTPVKGLYLTGASTHPGGGVFGASGRNTAGVVARDLR
jgi:phytoene dehydrogenase-like protein